MLVMTGAVDVGKLLGVGEASTVIVALLVGGAMAVNVGGTKPTVGVDAAAMVGVAVASAGGCGAAHAESPPRKMSVKKT